MRVVHTRFIGITLLLLLACAPLFAVGATDSILPAGQTQVFGLPESAGPIILFCWALTADMVFDLEILHGDEVVWSDDDRTAYFSWGGISGRGWALRLTNHDVTGTIRLFAQATPGPSTHGAMPLGQPLSFAMDSQHVRTYTFAALAGQGLRMVSNHSAVVILSPTGATSYWPDLNDDVSVPSLPETGTYTVLIHCALRSALEPLPPIRRLCLTLLPSANHLVSGQRVSGSLAETDLDTYTFDGNADESVLLWLKKPAAPAPGWGWDTYLELRSPSGEQVTPALGNTLNWPRLNETGTWHVFVIAKHPVSYTLCLVTQNGALTTASDADGGPIASGETKTGMLLPGDIDAYRFHATAGDCAIYQHRQDPDVFTYLMAPSGTVTQFPHANLLTETGDYLIVSGSDKQRPNAVGLALRSGAQTSATDPDGGVIQSNDNRTGFQDLADLDGYKFYGRQGDVVCVRALTPPGEPHTVRFWIFYPDGSLDPVEPVSKHGWVLPQTGTYWIVCDTWNAVDASLYRISFVKMPGRLTSPEDNDGGAIAFGETRSGYLRPADYDAYSFQGAAGEQIHAALQSPSATVAKRLELYAPDGSGPVQSETDIYQTLTRSGTYHLLVYDLTGEHTANYTLSLEAVPPQVVSTRPAAGDTRAGLDPVKIVFSRAMAPDSFEGNIVYQKVLPTGYGVNNVDVPFTPEWPDARTLVLQPGENIAFGQRYRVLIKAGVTSSGGVPLGEPCVLNFVTSQSAIAGTVPANGATTVSLTPTIRVTFRWPVKPASAEAKLKLILFASGWPEVPCTWTWKTPRLVAELTPDDALLPNAVYVLQLTRGLALYDGYICQWTETNVFSTGPSSGALPTVAAVAAAAEAGSQITITLSATADVEVTIANLAGRTVAVLPARRLPGGISTLLWNGRSAAGTKVPAGRYLARVVARGPGGVQAQACAAVQVR